MTSTNRQNGGEQELAAYEKDLAGYLQERIKPGLSRSAIPPLARSIAKEIARSEPPAALDRAESQARANSQDDEEHPEPDADEQPDAQDEKEQPDFEANMHELQADLGEDWILRFSVQGDEAWLTAEKEDGSQRVEAPDAQRLITIVDAIDECGGRQP